MKENRKIHNLINKAINIVFWLCMTVTLWFVLQVFIFASFKIPSDSMEPGLITGDNILVCKPTEYPENTLVPYPVILAASKGDPDAMKIVLQHFSGYIARLSMRKLYDERGNVYFGVDEEIRERLQTKLMRAILTFKAE